MALETLGNLLGAVKNRDKWSKEHDDVLLT